MENNNKITKNKENNKKNTVKKDEILKVINSAFEIDHNEPISPIHSCVLNESLKNIYESILNRSKYKIFKEKLLKIKYEDEEDPLKFQGNLKYSQNSSNVFIIEKNNKDTNIKRRLRKTFNSFESDIESNKSLYSENNNSDILSFIYDNNSLFYYNSSFNFDSSKLCICESNNNSCDPNINLLKIKKKDQFSEMINGHLKLITYKECPRWLADNPYIHAFYRPPCYSYLECYKSLFYLHNEIVSC